MTLAADLGPGLPRQRVIIEATTSRIVKPDRIASYLVELSRHLGMTTKEPPLTYDAYKYLSLRESEEEPVYSGYAGWLYWVSSGVHVHTYPTQPPLFTCDIYTCKAFETSRAVSFTSNFIKPKEIVWDELIRGA